MRFNYYFVIFSWILYDLCMNIHSKNPQDTNVRCSFIIDEELLNRVKAYMKQEDRNLSSVVRLALKKLLDSAAK